MKQKSEKKNRRIVPTLGMIALVILIYLASKNAQSPPGNSRVESGKATPNVPLPQPSNVLRVSVSEIQQTAKALKQNRQKNPDDYYTPSNQDPEYLIKVAHHHRIGPFLTSPYKNTSHLRDVLIHLLANGYGIDHWAGAVGFLYDDTFLSRVATTKMQQSGKSPAEIQEALMDPEPEIGTTLWFRSQELSKRDSRLRRLALMSGIADTDVLNGILEFHSSFSGLALNKHLLGDTVTTIQPGDRLYTDEDWLNPEFIEAKESYDGPPRPSRWDEQKTILDLETQVQRY